MQNVVNVHMPGCCSSIASKLPAVPVELNLSFVQSVPGIFKMAHTLLGMVCFTVIAFFSQLFHPISGEPLGLLCSKSDAFFLLVTHGFFVTSFVLAACCTFSYFTASFLPKTSFELTYHLTACIMYLTASLTLLVTIISEASVEQGGFKPPGFEGKIAAASLGVLNSILYGVSSYFSFQARQQMG